MVALLGTTHVENITTPVEDLWKTRMGLTINAQSTEEYLYSYIFGAFWAPLYEAWKQTRIMEESAIN